MALKKILLATHNQDKVKEIRELLKDLDVEIISANDIPELPEVDEDQETLEGNAIKKAKVLSQISGLPAIADDTGLEVDALYGAPGVRSSRYAGDNASYDDNVNKLLLALQDVPADQRTAQFRCVVAIVENGKVETVEGICKGVILSERRGHQGFGYDPVFYVPSMGKTFAEMDIEEKNAISHRGIALRKARAILEKKF